MRMTIDGPLTPEEWSRLVHLIKEMDQGRTDRVISMFFDEGDDLFVTPKDLIDWADSVGLPHTAVVPFAKTKVYFESGGGVRVVPIQPGEEP